VTQLSLSDIAIEFGATTILEHVTFTVAAGERWGVVGRNGSGKTSLFKVITGEIRPVRGAVAMDPGLRVSLLDQHRDFGNAKTVWDAAALPWAELVELEISLAEQATAMSELGDKVSQAALDKYGHDMERFSHLGGYTFHSRVDAVLQGLGFDAEDSKTRLVSTLSGGERGRVGLAGQIAAPADVLLLDEPTNHLDLATTEWLQNYLKVLDETVIVISHDRAFLDEIADHILHLEARTGTAYRGGYSSFVQQRTENRLTLERQHAKQQVMIKKEEEYIRRNIAGVNTAQAKGRRKRLERLPRLTPPPGSEGAMSLRLEAAERGGDQVIIANKLNLGVENRTLLRDFTATVNRGDILALVGPNGAGKTTLVSTILGERQPQGGEARLGGSITPAYFKQNLDNVPLDKTLYDAINDKRPLWTRGAIQNHLGAFGFSGDEVFRECRGLSGGERARMALALIVLQHANLLILDEPTNHLDVESIEAIEDAIEEYEGTVLIVSHDRALLRELSTRVWEYSGDRIVDFGGTFVEWEQMKKESALKKRAADALASDDKRVRERAQAKVNAATQADEQATRKAKKKAVAEAERAVQETERKIANLKEQLADPTLYDGTAEQARLAGRLDKELAAAERALDIAMERWETAQRA
jgi:ATP-binding cassette subfamily F protein 3